MYLSEQDPTEVDEKCYSGWEDSHGLTRWSPASWWSASEGGVSVLPARLPAALQGSYTRVFISVYLYLKQERN